MLRLILGRDWKANRDAVMSRIARDVAERRGNRILIVPELISHETERALCVWAGDTASRYAEVLSFSRLARRAAESAGSGAMECLDNGGRVVAMAAAARQLSSRLKAYAAVETKPEFLTDLIDAVDEFKRCCISSEDLKLASKASEGSFAQKLEELALLMEGYDSLCARGKRDPRDQMTWLLQQLEEGTFAQEHVFYIDGFPDFTRQNMAILEHMIRCSPEVTVSLNCDRPDSHLMAFEKAGGTASQILKAAAAAGVETVVEVIPEEPSVLAGVRGKLFQGAVSEGTAAECLQVFRADDPWTETMSAAHEVQRLVRSGCRYRDISLVCTDMNIYQPLVNLIFHRLNIPVYRSGTEEILQKSIISTVLTALDAALSDYDQRNVLRYLRSALSGVDLDTGDLLENYAFTWGIRGTRWLTAWENHPDGLGGEWTAEAEARLAELNRAREAVITPLEKLRQGFREASSLKGQVLALYGFLEDIRLERRLADMAEEMDAAGDNRSAQILNQLWEILMSAMEQLHDVLGETAWESEHFVRLFRLLLSQYDVGTIPPVLDAVHIGPVNAMRCRETRHLILLGAQEGNLPGYSGSGGVFTDQERVALRQLGVPLTGGAMEGIQEEFAEIYGVFCGASESIRVYASGQQPSFVYRRLAELSGGEKNASDGTGFAGADAREAGFWLAQQDGEEAAGRMGLGEEYRSARRCGAYALGKVESEQIRSLYGSSLNLSASKVDAQAECRLSYFLKYGLKAQERREAVVDPAEFGTYVHAVLENTAREVMDKGGFHQISREETLEIAHRHSDAYARERFSQIDSERAVYLFRRNLRELDMVVEELWEELRESQFQPAGFEVDFGNSSGSLPPIAIPNDAIGAILRGYVDRVDVWHSPGSDYYRVVDYKTGKKDFDYCDVFNGVGLQMLLYLFALESSGTELLSSGAKPAGVQYFPARVPYKPTDGMLTDEEARDERAEDWKRKGLLLKDEAVLQAMEPGEAPTRLCYSVKKDGSISGDLADREQLRLLQGYVFRVLGKLVTEIASGNVEPNPYSRGSSHDACRFCPYGSVCHRETVENRRNYKKMSAQRFWDEIEKEMTSHG